MTACIWEFRANLGITVKWPPSPKRNTDKAMTAYSSHRSGRLRHTILETIDGFTMKSPRSSWTLSSLGTEQKEHILKGEASACLPRESLHLCLSVQTLQSKGPVWAGPCGVYKVNGSLHHRARWTMPVILTQYSGG